MGTATVAEPSSREVTCQPSQHYEVERGWVGSVRWPLILRSVLDVPRDDQTGPAGIASTIAALMAVFGLFLLIVAIGIVLLTQGLWGGGVIALAAAGVLCLAVGLIERRRMMSIIARHSNPHE
jgi:Flp pilus assembly protein TadB